MSNIVCIGAGQTGRGFINRFFKDIPVIFLDCNEGLIRQLQSHHEYTINFASQRAPLKMNNYSAYLLESAEGEDALKKADLVMISVGQQNLKKLVPILQNAFLSRNKREVTVITCENGVNVKKELLPLCENPLVHITEAIIFCTTLKQNDSLDIFSEDLDYLPYDVGSLSHPLPFKGMIAENNLEILMQRKIYTYNCISAVISYLGYYKGYENYAAAANDEEISSCISHTVKVLNKCICREYNVASEEQEKFSKMAVTKFQNKSIIDTIERNARDVDRKLGLKERIMAPLHLMMKYDDYCRELLLTAACALYYGRKTDTLLKSVNQYLTELDNSWKKEILHYLELLEQQKSIQMIMNEIV